ncbi:C40 family peptidase [Diaphorobacter ruginosibacter]|jgi:cell wall-associated NlpC family hydrolase|uniref:C40 family peptidase n=1 Tax=Diaphorobacter ruginosibacter TaxID=1715720 RepID=A0A7G9RMM0_9BURK|nr:C40 family peptidase [Diaphorobacter ruginosibacter]MDR2336378.1 C40 family peptidase [Burkholderiaceae bacterium]QNN56845.1 C40 family peptidase [Diaphorobacter ruginosibacter]
MRALQTCLTLAVAVLLAACGSAPTTSRTSSSGTWGQGVSRLSEAQADDIAIHAMGLVGTPYRYGGNTPAGGFDCSGLIGYVYQNTAGVAPPRTVSQLDEFGKSISEDDLRTGDLVLFGGSRPTHAGIYVGNGRFVHAPSTGGTVRLDSLQSKYWSRQRMSFRRF